MMYLAYAGVGALFTVRNWISLVRYRRTRDRLWWATLAFCLFSVALLCGLCWMTDHVDA